MTQMDKREFATFAMALKTYYPKEALLPNQQAMELWYRELCDIPFDVAEAAMRKWVSTNKWSPSIAELRELAAEVQHGKLPDWGEGWQQVIKAIKKYGYYNQKQAMESLDPFTRDIVRRIGFANLCLSDNPTADRANFRMLYEELARREQTRQQMALPLQQTINRLQLKFSSEGQFLGIEGGTDNG